jgi:hypothetical protein
MRTVGVVIGQWETIEVPTGVYKTDTALPRASTAKQHLFNCEESVKDVCFYGRVFWWSIFFLCAGTVCLYSSLDSLPALQSKCER